MPGESSVAMVDQNLREQDAMIRLLKANLNQAQARMKGYADKGRSKRTFEVGDMVFFIYSLITKLLWHLKGIGSYLLGFFWTI